MVEDSFKGKIMFFFTEMAYSIHIKKFCLYNLKFILTYTTLNVSICDDISELSDQPLYVSLSYFFFCLIW